MEAHGAIWSSSTDHPETEVATCPICCDSTLDEDEIFDPYCSCGFQQCCFCLHRIQNEGDNACPHCRTSYDAEPQQELYERLSKLVEQRQQAEKEARLANPQQAGAATVVLEIPKNPQTAPLQPPPPPPNMKLEEDTIWPGLAVPQRPQKPPIQKKSSKALPPTAAAPLNNTSLGLLAVPDIPLEYSTTSDWMNSNSSCPSSAPTASGTATPSPSPSGNTVTVNYHGTASGLVPSIEPLYASGQCLINLDNTGTTGNIINLESAALLNGVKMAVKSKKISVERAAATLMQHLLDTSKHEAMFNDSVGFGMLSEQGLATAMNNSNVGGGSLGGGDTESLFAGMSLFSDSNAQNNLSMPSGFSFRGPPPGFQGSGLV